MSNANQGPCGSLQHYPDFSRITFEAGDYYHSCPTCFERSTYTITPKMVEEVRRRVYGSN